MKSVTLSAPCLLIALFLVAGCNRDKPAAQPKPPVAAGTGVITGVVTFTGGPSAAKPIGDELCGDHHVPKLDESLIVDADGGMRNVVVYLENGPNVPTSPEPAVLDQTGCRYVPHVLAVRTNQPLVIRSSDPIQHNVHAWKSDNKPFNLAYTQAGQERTVTLPKPEFNPPIEVRCDVHQWMRAYVAVFDHPFFTVTGAGGKFEIKNVPPGTYTLVARHETYLEKRATVTVGDGATEVKIQYEK